jgi:hypothetical protein
MRRIHRREEIQRSAEELKAGLTELSAEKTAQIRRQLAELYIGNALWDEARLNKWSHFFTNNAADREVIADFEAWEWIDGFIHDKEVLLLFDYREGEPVYKIAKGDKVVTIIARIWSDMGENFYVTDENLSFLLGFWTDGLLYGLGAAKEWLHRLKLGAIYQMLNAPEQPIHVTQMEVVNWGTQFIFHCVYDPQGEPKPFKLIFRETCEIELDPAFRKETPVIDLVYLYKRHRYNWTVISSQNGRLKMRYKELTLEKEWNI